MLQRKQTLFLLAALILTIVCLCIPVATFVPQTMGASEQMYNLWIADAKGGHDLSVWPLFAILLLSTPFNVAAIFGYKNRKLQARFCLFLELLMLGWYAVYAVFSQVADRDTFHVTLAAALPLVSLILYVLARRAILADEALVRAADRIR